MNKNLHSPSPREKKTTPFTVLCHLVPGDPVDRLAWTPNKADMRCRENLLFQKEL